jgi:hypothetical protein
MGDDVATASRHTSKIKVRRSSRPSATVQKPDSFVERTD